jgi:large subunit ribosomal protein L19
MDAIMNDVEEAYMKKKTPRFNIGDTVDVHIKIREGDRERVQVFTGTVISRRGSGTRETFTVRRIVAGEGVERVFPLHSPVVTSIEVARKGRVKKKSRTKKRGRKARKAKDEAASAEATVEEQSAEEEVVAAEE